MKPSDTRLLATEVVPITELLRGERMDVRAIWSKAKEKPLHLVYEAFALVMMGVGAYVTVEWAYRMGFQAGYGLF